MVSEIGAKLFCARSKYVCAKKEGTACRAPTTLIQIG
jgi:hypothetical protein